MFSLHNRNQGTIIVHVSIGSESPPLYYQLTSPIKALENEMGKALYMRVYDHPLNLDLAAKVFKLFRAFTQSVYLPPFLKKRQALQLIGVAAFITFGAFLLIHQRQTKNLRLQKK